MSKLYPFPSALEFRYRELVLEQVYLSYRGPATLGKITLLGLTDEIAVRNLEFLCCMTTKVNQLEPNTERGSEIVLYNNSV